jgi:hypothetical protein
VISLLFEEATDQSELIYNEIRTLSAELDSMWMCYVANNFPFLSFSTYDQVIVSHDQEIVKPGPRPVNISIDQEARYNHDFENVTSCHKFYNGVSSSPELVPLHHSFNEAPYRRPCSSPNTMSIQYLVHDNISRENPETSDVQLLAPQLAVGINIQHLSSNQELPRLSVTTPDSPEGEENGGEVEGGKKVGEAGGEVNGNEGENDVEGEKSGVEGEENGKTRDEREKEQNIQAEKKEQEDDNDKKNNNKVQQERNEKDNNEKTKSSIQKKKTIDNIRVREKKAVFSTEQSIARMSKKSSK